MLHVRLEHRDGVGFHLRKAASQFRQIVKNRMKMDTCYHFV